MHGYDDTTYGERLASVYDTLYAARDPVVAVERLAELAGAGPVLELGVGSGRIAIPLSKRGFTVHGIESSQAMIAQLRAKPNGAAVHVLHGDFADVAAEGPYSLIFAAWNTFFFLRDQDAQVACMRRAAGRLAAGGCVVLECFVPDPTRFAGNQLVETVQVAADRVWLAAARHDPLTQTIARTEIDVTEIGTRLYPVCLRYAWPAELDLMARLAGLALESRWADWDASTYGPTSSRHVSVYRRGG